jgi:3D (Asp-Asp-Asp) domain-containing protein
VLYTALSGHLLACGPAAPWTAESADDFDAEHMGDLVLPPKTNSTPARSVRSIGATRPADPSVNPEVVEERIALSYAQGRVLGAFENTYYDFPSESDYTGETTALHDAQCRPIANVRAAFFDALCVQGSGMLDSGVTVSFARRDCSCARVCPRTSQKICFEALDKNTFPWGRGATGKGIVPLLSVAVDPAVIPLETSLYIPEYEGLPRDARNTAQHDGCFIAQDRGSMVQGKHVDVFTGEPAVTRLWNRLVPSHRGVTVVLNSPKCAR